MESKMDKYLYNLMKILSDFYIYSLFIDVDKIIIINNNNIYILILEN